MIIEPLVKKLVQMVKMVIPLVQMVQMLPTNFTIGEPRTHAMSAFVYFLGSGQLDPKTTWTITVIRDAYIMERHFQYIFTLETKNTDPDCPRKNEKAKKFFPFVNFL